MIKMNIEDRLKHTVEQEIKILREILENIHHEQKALFNRNLDELNHIIEERLDLLEAFEKFNETLIASTVDLANYKCKTIPKGGELTYQETLELLKDLVAVDNIELQYSLDQLRIITEEIEKMNGITLSYLESKPTQTLECTAHFRNPLHIIDGQYREKPKKITLGLLEPEEDQNSH